MKRLGWEWEQLAGRRPLQSILTHHDGKAVPSCVTEDEFFATGRTDAAEFLQRLADLAPNTHRRRVLDFGCGVGRVTRALGAHFESAVGVDASPTMIRLARAATPGPRCQFIVNRRPHLRVFPTGHFDVVYSRLVLQHIRPALVRRYLPELCRVLSRDGVLMFQLPEIPPTDPLEAFENEPVHGRIKRLLPQRIVRVDRRLKFRFIAVDGLHQFGMPRAEVESLVSTGGCRLLAVFPDNSHGRQEPPGFAYWGLRT